MEQVITYNAPAHQNRHLKLAVGTDLNSGNTRQHKSKKDSLFAIQGTQTYKGRLQSFGVFVVADGIGGHTCGGEASNLALRVISNSIAPMLLGNAALGQYELQELLLSSVQRANEAIYQYNEQEGTNMGTAVTAALVVGATAYVANVGDSRAYLYREPGRLYRVTHDHSVVAREVETGINTAADNYAHPRRNQLVRYLGEKASVEVDVFTAPLQAGDKLLLCSDGLWEMTRDPDIQQIMGIPAADPSQAVEALIQAALASGGSDNVSIIVVFVF